MQRKISKDILTTDTLRHALGPHAAQFETYCHQTTDSTNADSKRLAASGKRYAIISAETQTAGRGRMGRSFYSPDATGVYFSILYTFFEPITGAVTITAAAAVAVMRAIRKICGKQTDIKWVNDLYLNEKKVCGILAESVLDPSHPGEYPVIIGIGINLRTNRFPTELTNIAGAVGSDASRAELIAAVTKELSPYLQNPADRSWLEDYKKHSCILGKEITWSRGDEVHTGRAIDIDRNGALLVEEPSGTHVSLFTGEISVRAI